MPASTRCWIQQAPARVLPAPRPATYAQTRQSPAGGRWLGRPRGCTRHSPGRRAARAGFGVPIPGRAVGQLGRFPVIWQTQA